MISHSTIKRNRRREWLLKSLSFVVAVAVIVSLLPRDNTFNYLFDVNKPWRYGQLIAAFDFPILKSDDVVRREQDSLLSTFLPYFSLDATVADEAIARLRADDNSGVLSALPSADYLSHIEQTLSAIYKVGILPTESFNSLTADSLTGIRIVENKQATRRSLTALYSVTQAYNHLLNADTLHYGPEVLKRCALNEYILPNLAYDRERTETAKAELIDNYAYANGLVVAGQKIIDRGEIVSRETYNILQSLRKEYSLRSDDGGGRRLMLIGQILFVGIFILGFMLYVDIYRVDFYEARGSLPLIIVMIVVFCVATSVMVANHVTDIYYMPYAMLPLLLRVFLDSRTAFFAHVTTILICSLSITYPHEFIMLQLAAGVAAVFSLRELSQRSQIFTSALCVILSYCIVFFAYELITESDLSKLNLNMYLQFVVSGVLLLFSYPLMFLVEKVFGFTSNVTLVELSNINTPLLRRLSETVPGTFQHSMQVANLAAEAANRIGAKSQLVRTGALYHDIGKMNNPAFFTENQSSGVNPHKNLTYEQSAQVVIGHVTDGLRIAEHHRLPKAIKDFITTHHGRGLTRYFYISWVNEHPGEEPDKSLFTYPGPNPQTAEQAILMMADAVEAASRSLKEYNEETIGQLVDKLVDTQVEEGYFRECPITFKDIATVKAVFKEKLKTMYHTRISYPELKKRGGRKAKKTNE